MSKIELFFYLLIDEFINKLVSFVTFFVPGSHLKCIVRGYILKMKFKQSGTHITIDRAVTINHPNNLVVGNNVYFAKDVWINAHYGLTIGSNVQLSPMVVVTTGAHGISKYGVTNDGKQGRVNIGSNVWIASHCTISAGVNIGNNVIVAANSVVLYDVPDNVMVAGIPARIIKSLV